MALGEVFKVGWKKQDPQVGRSSLSDQGTAKAALSRAFTVEREKDEIQEVVEVDPERLPLPRLRAPVVPLGDKVEPLILDMRGATLAYKDDLVIDGSFHDGTLNVGRLIINEGALVSGNISATEIRNRGKLVGDIRADRVYLYKGSVTEGKLYTKDLAMSVGCKMTAMAAVGEEHSLSEFRDAPVAEGGSRVELETVDG